jgi:hypothetical protein
VQDRRGRCNGATRPRADFQQQQRTDQERGGVERKRLTGADAEHQRRRQRRADHDREVRHRLGQRGRLLDHRLGHRLRDQACVGRLEERACGAEQRLDHDQLPDPDRAGEDQHRDRHMQRRADRVGRDHDPMARQAVGPDAAEQHQRDHRQRLRGEHEPKVGRRACQPRDENRQGHDHDLVADRAGGLAEEQIAEVLVAQDALVRTHGTHSEEGKRRELRRTRRPSAGGGRGAQRATVSVARIGGRGTISVRVMLSIVAPAYQLRARRQLEFEPEVIE